MQRHKHKRPVSRRFWNYLKFLPKFIREEFIRSKFTVPDDLPKDLELKIAETESEIKQALKLIHDSYVELGYMEQKKEAVRFTKFIALPTTVILIAKYQDEVLGTISIIPDSPLGLPSDLTWTLNTFREKAQLIGEVSGLAINKNTKMRRSGLFLPLCKLMFEYATKAMNIDILVISTTMEVEYFYTDVLLFKKIINKTGQENPVANGNKSTCCYLNLHEGFKNYKKVYSKKENKFNLFQFFCETQLSQINLNSNKSCVSSKLFLKNKSIAKIISENPNLIDEFSLQDKIIISNFDPIRILTPTLALNEFYAHLYTHKERFPIYKNSLVFNCENKTYESQLIDASKNGFQLRIKDAINQFNINDDILLEIKLNEKLISCNAKIKWINNTCLGCEILSSSKFIWRQYTNTIFEEINEYLEVEKKAA